MIRKVVSIYRSAYSGLPPMAWVLFTVQLVNSSGSMVLFYLSLYLTRPLHYTLTQAGQVLSFYGIGQLVGAFVGGWFSDRLGSSRVQGLSLFICGLLYITIGFVHSFLALSVLVFLLAIANGALYPANSASMTRVCPLEVRPRGYALARLATNMGVTIGPVLGGFLARRDYRLLFWVDGITSLAAAVVFWRLFREPKAESAAPAGGSSRSPWRDGPFLYLLGLVLLMGLIFFQFFTTFSVYLSSAYGFRENQIGLLITINTLMIIFFEMPIVDRLKSRNAVRVIAAASLFLGLGFALMPWGRGMLYAGLTVAVWSVGEILSMPLLTALVASRSRAENQGRYLGAFSFAFSLAFVFSPALGVSIYQRLGPKVLWTGCGAVGLLIFLGFLFFERLETRP